MFAVGRGFRGRQALRNAVDYRLLNCPMQANFTFGPNDVPEALLHEPPWEFEPIVDAHSRFGQLAAVGKRDMISSRAVETDDRRYAGAGKCGYVRRSLNQTHPRDESPKRNRHEP